MWSCFMFIIQKELDEMKSMWNTHYVRELRDSECPPGQPNVLYFMPEQPGGRSFRFPVSEMDINACHPFLELPDVNDCTDEMHELVRLIMREEELALPSNATEAKHGFISIIRNIDLRPHWFWENISFEQRKHFIVLIFHLWEKIFRRGSFCGGSFYNFNPYSQNLFYIIKISEFQELIPQSWTFHISNHVSSLYSFLTNVKISPSQKLIPNNW